MNITFLELLILALSSFRLTRLVVFDKITAFIRNFFIDEVEEKDENGEMEIYLVPKKGVVKGFLGELLSCYWCTGVWSSIALCALYLIYPTIAIPVLLVLAVSGLAAIIETIIQLWI
ncbi:DUF1360 domain-containing protein [Bacillus sp. V3B]|uniref:DUF1360 domain-containing protein n=1 Tax=Bacillus sp. V3B TaxID=2804915 RepID=UPI0021087F3B|nr:DUF1360 domain-containing protein [Bacillus sp. V3B]MCQ6274288.1 DUF1360 domain-containing protein [Bacillus sp. V3B]